jgi:multidrug transporter EmrE-like cation transporter
MFESLFASLKKWSEESILDEVIIIAIIISLCEAFAQNYIKNSESNVHFKMFVGLTFYIVLGFLLHHAYNNYELSRVNVVWSCISIITATVLGYILYNEHISFNNIISVIAACVAVYFSI